MKAVSFIFMVCLGWVLFACSGTQKVGGPCRYITTFDRANVTQISESYITLTNARSQYDVDLTLFESEPQMGQVYRVDYSKITQGSCTPISIKSVKLVSNF